MRNSILSSLFHKSAPTKNHRIEQQEYVENLTGELATAEIDTRFRDTLRTGETMGDVIMVDDQGNPVSDMPKRKNILGL